MAGSPYVGGIAPADPPPPPGQQQYEAMAQNAGQAAADAWKHDETVRLMHGGYKPGEVQSYFGEDAGAPHSAVLDAHVAGNLGPHVGTVQSPLDALAAGWNMSVTGLALRAGSGSHQLPDTSQDQDLLHTVLSGAGQFAGDLPATFVGMGVGGTAGVAAGGAVGAAAAAPTGELAAPVTAPVGAVAGGLAGAGFGAAAVPQGMREALMFAIDHHEVHNWSDAVAVISGGTYRTLKSGTIGAASSLIGGVVGSKVIEAGGSKVVAGLANTTAMATSASAIGAGMEGHMPTMKDFVAGSVLALGFHAAGTILPNGRFVPNEAGRRVTANMQKAYAQTGIPPWELASMASHDPVLRQELMQQDINGDPVLAKHHVVAPNEPEPYAPPVNGMNERLAAAEAEGQGKPIAPAPAFGKRKAPPTITPTGDPAVDAFMPVMRGVEGSVDASVSPKGAIGRYQIMPATARQYGFDPDQLHDANYNEHVAKVIAADLSRRANGDQAAMLIGYNAGPGRMGEYLRAGAGTRLEAERDPTANGGIRYEKVPAPKDESFLPFETQKYLANARRRAGGDLGHPLEVDVGLRGGTPFAEGPSAAKLDAEATKTGEGGTDAAELDREAEAGGGGSLSAASSWEGAPLKDLETEILSNIGEQPKADLLNPGRLASQFFSELAPARAIDDRLIASGQYNRVQQMGFEDYLRQTYASNARAGVFARYGEVDPATKEIIPNTPTFMDSANQMRKNGGTRDGMNAYLMSLRTVEKQGQGIDTGINPMAARELIANAEAKAKYGEATDTWNAVNRGFLRYMKGSGMISEDQEAAMNAGNSSTYVSFRRLRGDDGAFGGSGRGFGVSQTLRKMEGSDRQIVDPLLATLDNQRVGIQMADRNQARLYLVNRAMADPEVAALVGLKKVGTVDPNYDEIDKALKAYGFKDEDLEKAREAYAPLIAARAEKGLDDNQFLVYRDGKPEKWSVSDPDFARLMRNADSPGEANILGKVMQTFAAAQRTGIVLQPDFPGRMTIWHQFNQFVMDPLHPPPVFTWLRGIAHVVGQDDVYQRAVAKGALGAAMVDMDRNWLAQDMNDTFEKTGIWDAVPNMVKHPLQFAQIIGEKLDAANRVGYMINAEGKGIDSVKAATMARKSGLDYAEKATSQIVNNISKNAAFFRPHLLGMKQGWEAFADNGDGKGQMGNAATTIAHAVAVISVPMVALYAANWIADKNLPDGEKYSDLPRWERDTMFVTPPIGGVRLKLRLPANFGMPFGGMVNRTMDALVAQDPRAFDKWANDFLAEYVPNAMPTVAAPALEVAANHSFFTGQPLISDKLKKNSPDLQYTDATTAPAKALAHYLNIGLKTVDLEQVSPIQVEHLVQGWAGPVGMGALQAINAPFAPPGPPMDVSDIPFVKGFVVRNPKANAQPISDFYANMKDFEAAHADFGTAMQHAEATGSDADLTQVQSAMQNPKAYTDMRDLADVSKAIQMQRSMLFGIYGDKTMTTAEKRQAIEDVYSQMVATAKMGNMLMAAGADEKGQ